MPFEIDGLRPAANPMQEVKLTLSASVSELPNKGGFSLEISLSGAGIVVQPQEITATLTKSDTIAGSFPGVKAGDTIAGAGIPGGTKIDSVTEEGLKLTKPITEEGIDVKLTITPPPAGKVALATLDIPVVPGNDGKVGTIFEITPTLISSAGSKVLGSGSIVLDTELSANRIPQQ